MKRIVLPVLFAFVVGPLTISAAAADSAADAAWIAKCMAQLKEEHADAKSRRAYCACMHGYFEDNEPVRQTEMERMFPPAHLLCHKKAGWK